MVGWLACAAAGVLALAGVQGTYAYWTDSATVDGTSLTSGTLDLTVSGDPDDAISSTALSMSAMVPGSKSAEVLSVSNTGTAPLRYAVAAGLSGNDAELYTATASITLRVVADASASGGACVGGSARSSGKLTTAMQDLGLSPVLPSGATESICLELALSETAPPELQGAKANVPITLTATSRMQ